MFFQAVSFILCYESTMNKYKPTFPVFSIVLCSLLISISFPAKSDDSTVNNTENPNHSVNVLSVSVLDALTLATHIIYARDIDKSRDEIIVAIDALDKELDQFAYPASVYQVISDAKTRQKIQRKNKEKLFNAMSRAAQTVYQSSKKCFSDTKLVDRNIVDSPSEDKTQKKINFTVQFGDCKPAQIELSDVSRIDGNYYFASIKASPVDSKPKKAEGIAFQYEVAGLFKNGVAPAKLNGLWGLIDTTGKWLVSPQYKEIGRLSEGLVAVEKNGKFAFIDASLKSAGKVVIPFKYDKAQYFSTGLAAVKIGDKWGFIDKKGSLKIRARYDNVRNFKRGFAPVKIKNKWGYINAQGKWLVKPVYNAAYSFTDDGLAVVVSKNKRGFINTQGRFAIKPSYRRVQRFTEGSAPVSKKKNNWFFVDNKNQLLFSQHFAKVRNFSESMTAVMNNDQQWGYINKAGKLNIGYQFDKAYDFKDGLALVRKGDKRGFVNKQGDIVVPMIYDDAFRFSEGLAPVKKGELWGYIKKPLIKP